MRYHNLSVSLINATNDSEMKRYANMVSQLFPELRNSPYRDRIFAVLDSVHGKDIVDTLAKKGIPEASIVRWSGNGIEYVYPPNIMAEIFGGEGPISILGDEVTCKVTTIRKRELATRVADRLKPDTEYHPEMVSKLFSILTPLD